MIQHPLSAAFPAMSPLELGDLTNDIRANGQRHPIVMLDDMVLDGWHRARACATLSREPLTVALAAGIEPVAYVQSVNLHRRHMTGSQRAASVVTCSEWAKSGENQYNRGGEVASPPREVASPLTVAEMAKVADVSQRTIQQAKKAQEAGLGDAVRDGKVTAEQAAEIAKLPEPERLAALETPPAPKPAPKPKPKPKPKAKAKIKSEPGGGSQTPDSKLTEKLEKAIQDAKALKDENQTLRAENEGLKKELEARVAGGKETAQMLQEAMKDITSLEATLSSEDRLTSLVNQVGELKRQLKELNRVDRSRIVGLMDEVNETKQAAKRWMGKFQRLERQIKAAEGVEAEPEVPDEEAFLNAMEEAG